MTLSDFKNILQAARIGIATIAGNTQNDVQAIADVSASVARGIIHSATWEKQETETQRSIDKAMDHA